MEIAKSVPGWHTATCDLENVFCRRLLRVRGCPDPRVVDIGLINQAVPFADLEDPVWRTAEQLAAIPFSQLCAMKLVVNQADEHMGLHATQVLGPILDGLMRNTPDAKRFIDLAAKSGVRAAITERDGPFGDDSQAPCEHQPNPAHVIAAAPPRRG